MHSHHNLSEIFYYLWGTEHGHLCRRGGFHDLVFRIVMYHQSLEGCSKWPHMFVFSTEERDVFCDPPLFKLIKLLMVADSGSYNFFQNKELQDDARAEFIANNDRMCQEWVDRRAKRKQRMQHQQVERQVE